MGLFGAGLMACFPCRRDGFPIRSPFTANPEKDPLRDTGGGLRAGERLLRRKGDFNLGLAAGRCRVHSGGDFGDAQTDNLPWRVAEDDDRDFSG